MGKLRHGEVRQRQWWVLGSHPGSWSPVSVFWTECPQILMLKVSNSQWDSIRRHSLWEIIRFRWGHDGISVPIIPQRTCSHALSLALPNKDTVIRWPSTSQEDSPHQKLTISAPWSWTSSLQNCKEKNVCCCSPLVYSLLLWQLNPTHFQYLFG